MSGFGTAPFGTAPYGLGTPATAPIPGGTILDDGTGVQTGSRYIDGTTGAYAFDEFGRVKGMSDARQMVLLALSTVKGSSAMRLLGHNLRDILDITPDFERQVTGTITAAMAHVVSLGFAEIVSIEVKRLHDWTTDHNERGALIRMKWRDLTDVRKPEYVENVR